MRNPVLINVQVAASVPTNKTINAVDGNEVGGVDDLKTKKAKQDDGKEETATKSKVNSYTPTTLTNYYMVTKLEERISRLVAFIQSHSDEKIIVFMLTCACVDFYGTAVRRILLDEENNKHDKNKKSETNTNMCIESLHGKMAQKRREKAMERYREASSSTTGSVLICTDVAARGLDVPDVDWVIQVDPPQDPSQFVHRVGRSARAGRKGSSLVFLTEKEEAYVDLLSNRQITLLELPENEHCRKPIQNQKVDASDAAGASANPDTDDAVDDGDESTTTIPNVLPKIRDLVLKDRDMLEKGTKAFTSYIRAYKEHVCSFIFR